MAKIHSLFEVVAFRCASAVFAFAGFLLSALSALVLAIIRCFITEQKPNLSGIRRQPVDKNRPAKSPLHPAMESQKQPATPSYSDSDATLVEDAASARVHFRDTLIVHLIAASPVLTNTRRVRTSDGLSRAGLLESSWKPGSTACKAAVKRLQGVVPQHSQPLQAQRSSEVASRQSGKDKPAMKPMVLRSASMPHLPQMKRSPKFTISAAAHDKLLRKRPAKVSKTSALHEAPHYVALPGLSSPAGDATGRGRKESTMSGVKFEQYHQWSRKAKSMRNLKAAQSDVTVHMSASTGPSLCSKIQTRRLAIWHAAPQRSISSVLLSAAEAEKGSHPSRVSGDGLPVRPRSVSGNDIPQRPLGALSEEQSPPFTKLFMRSMSTTALTELAAPEVVASRRPWFTRFRRRAKSVSSERLVRS
ncbi:uncharacterized protein B0H18DRAFT_194874 [Fomitopsis serialis]|uniref:uncharacterized protein n=1 Tax=Fomitopsis serialis TaxID=139415 RepID=UPI0020072D49|nr:uncharacterized protein B0H18DRAFT_194874 [Neoantrodia serialis]KAH9937359.1 hypothetical protein B0H18DRAFT_194874 [Neoantrodia serialis]